MTIKLDIKTVTNLKTKEKQQETRLLASPLNQLVNLEAMACGSTRGNALECDYIYAQVGSCLDSPTETSKDALEDACLLWGELCVDVLDVHALQRDLLEL